MLKPSLDWDKLWTAFILAVKMLTPVPRFAELRKRIRVKTLKWNL